MDHADHLNLIRDGIQPTGGVWAELGSGRGAFTLALAELLGDGATIHSIDRDGAALHAQERVVRRQFPHANLQLQQADFTQTLDLPALDGVLMANSLHFQAHPLPVLVRVRGFLKPGGRLVIVEYNITRGNYAVPHPISYARIVELAEEAGFAATRLLATRPSSMKEIYSALSTNPLP
jgi:ubiquinone/menaquinone biosynthesis C-methylase UbiE